MLLKKFKAWFRNNRFRFLVYIAIICIIVVIVIINKFKNDLTRVTIEDHSFYQYLSGTKFEYDGSISLNENDDITKLSFRDVTIELDSTPIFYKNTKKVLFPKKMSVIYPLSNVKQSKVNGYTVIASDGTNFTLTDGSLNKDLQNCFLYDGGDLYFFLSEINILVGKSEYLLSPFSYVIMKYNHELEIYNYDEDKYEIVEISNQEVYAKNDSYSINLSIDAVENASKSRLLIKKIDFLENLK